MGNNAARILTALTAVVGCLIAGQAVAQQTSIAPVVTQTLNRVCVPLFDGQPIDAARLDRQAEQIGLPLYEGRRWNPRAPSGTAVMVSWEEDAGRCVVTLFGPVAAGDAFVETLTPAGWTEQQRNVGADTDIVLDLWSGRPTTADATLGLIVARWTDADIPLNEPRMTVHLMRAP